MAGYRTSRKNLRKDAKRRNKDKADILFNIGGLKGLRQISKKTKFSNRNWL